MEEVLFLLLLDDDEAISSDAVEDVLLLSTVQPERPIIPDLRFCLTELVDADCEMIFRFDVIAVLALCRYFALPELMVKDQRDRAHSSEALFEGIIYFQRRICSERMQQYVEAVYNKGATMSNVFGFIDGTKNAVCRLSSRPGTKENLQRQVYSGHKRVHCLNYQAVVTPDGLAIHFWRPIEGRRHDVTLLHESKLIDYLEEHKAIFDGYTIYGDPAYGVRSLGVVMQVREVIITGTISNTGAGTIALGTATSCVLVTIAVANAWKFPIPFGYVLMTNLYVLIFFVWMILGIGPRIIARSSMLRQQIKAQLFIIANQGVVVVCYPVFSAVFDRLSATQQGVFVFLMPMIKFFTKQNIANAAKNSHEYVGPMVVFSVDLFNVYYVAICMQSAKSLVTTLIIIATDSLFIAIALRVIYKRANRLDASDTASGDDYLQALLGLVSKVFQEATFTRDSKQRIRLLAPFPLRLSDESSASMKSLSKTARLSNNIAVMRRISIKSPQNHTCTDQSMATIAVLPKQHQVAPENPPTTHEAQELFLQPRVPTSSVAKLNSILASKAREEVVHDALQSLFHSEYILLAEYIELMVPMLYSLYLVVLFHLPVAAYYPHTASMTAHELQGAVISILAYAAIELVSFTALLILLWRKFGFSPLYQLAFVLETQGPALQGYLFVWTITILHLALAHYGVDFNIRLT
ncbi:hypothetical protein PC116_g19548 [Phytophthora cactorum]|uniref:DDE Tnp4 domain-containing protein n=2 Tax=Phytophthora cactorum TaxID=29920 RepID=A0A329S409_9STRA|nr:hypothetical protein PC116_g19548 [Phytophthora cactorum]RAW31409.1 hypothetical protein PC110_g12239 [Phytophthora cactorum]